MLYMYLLDLLFVHLERGSSTFYLQKLQALPNKIHPTYPNLDSF